MPRSLPQPQVRTTSPAAWIHGEGTAVFVPEGYEPRYRYPLVCWLEDPAAERPEAGQWFPAASSRNCIVLALRAPSGRGGEGNAAWRTDELALWSTLDDVGTAIAELSAELSIHPDRVVLAGRGMAAQVAVSLACLDAERFCGAVAIDPLPEMDLPVCEDEREMERRLLVVEMAAGEPGERVVQRQAGLVVESVSCATRQTAARELMNWILSPVDSVYR
ncbi:hypothetical protein [Planctomyces sp. SH-PL14]|uniref:hypothetical protein n=1 Tax=Planctomyces sp. SH-PL14 TaxID=1632864 RepID=UPI00078B2864|nr:hypothetical protein [Planctomyces sp. SH-PL14]AMV22238.1 hypothetical protein VT03_30315 [Planctomyces sp. SH-PL14]